MQEKLKAIINVPFILSMVTYGCKEKDDKMIGGHLMKSGLLQEHISLKDHAASWQKAIQLAAQPLLEKKLINEHYITSMIQNVLDNGPYIVIMPDVAMPHSRSEDGAFATAVSILKLKEAVMFPQDKEVHLIIVLAAADNDAHMELLSDMVDVFMDEEKMSRILQSTTLDELKDSFA